MELRGAGVGRGLAVGRVLRMPEPIAEPPNSPHSGDPIAEFSAVLTALSTVSADLRALGQRAGGETEGVLEAAAMMANDPSVVNDIRKRINAGTTGERAVFEAFGEFQRMLLQLGGLMSERAADIRDVANRVIATLRGVAVPGIPASDAPFVLVARDLAPADTATLDLNQVLALVTSDGGPTSHTAILARSKSIPAVVGVNNADELKDGDYLIVDASTGTITIAPTDEQWDAARAKLATRGVALPILPGRLADGTAVPLLANLGSPEEAAAAVALGAEGVGLFRTEFLFLNSVSAPSIEVQQTQYIRMLEQFPSQKVIVRVLDAGADKPLPFLTEGHEDNPALGVRGLRALRMNEHLLRDQLTALATAQRQCTADLWVMAPMVADSEETDYFVALGRSLGLRTVGVMAEVPSLAVLADQVLETADFVSVGTNDLTQYTLAADRVLGTVSEYQDPWHPSVLRLIKLLGDAGAASGKPVGICGEAASDPDLAIVLVGLGATSLSMTPAAFADVRAALATVTLAEARARALAAIAQRTAGAARAAATA